MATLEHVCALPNCGPKRPPPNRRRTIRAAFQRRNCPVASRWQTTTALAFKARITWIIKVNELRACKHCPRNRDVLRYFSLKCEAVSSLDQGSCFISSTPVRPARRALRSISIQSASVVHGRGKDPAEQRLAELLEGRHFIDRWALHPSRAHSGRRLFRSVHALRTVHPYHLATSREKHFRWDAAPVKTASILR